MTVSVMITTRNRADDLARTLRALQLLAPPPAEVLITLDGCTDDSLSVVSKIWPEARVFKHLCSEGSITARDRMLRTATSDLVLSLDDDSYPEDTDFLRQAAEWFVQQPKLAVLCFPQRSEEFHASMTQRDFGDNQLTGSYASSGAIIRRSTYLQLEGYMTTFIHAYEEPDYALQCVAAGHVVARHTGLVIRHHYSAINRNEIRTHHQHARNECWSVLKRCPAPWWPFVIIKRTGGQFLYACRRGGPWIMREPLWWWQAMKGTGTMWSLRNPVSWSAYQNWRRLLRSPRKYPHPGS